MSGRRNRAVIRSLRQLLGRGDRNLWHWEVRRARKMMRWTKLSKANGEGTRAMAKRAFKKKPYQRERDTAWKRPQREAVP